MSVDEQKGILFVLRSFILDNTGKILLVKRSPKASWAQGKWEPPGGTFENGEDLEASRIRETREETGLTIETIKSDLHTESHVISDGGKHNGRSYVVIFSIAVIVRGTLNISEEHERAEWVTVDEAFRYDLTPESRKALHELFLFQLR